MLFGNTSHSAFRSILYGIICITVFSFSVFTIPAYAGEKYELGETRQFINDADASVFAPDTGGFTLPVNAPGDSVTALINKINALAAKVNEENRIISKLDDMYQVSYPIGITRKVGGLNYTIVLESDEITPQGAFLNAYMSFTIPGNGKSLTFAAYKIPLSASGGIAGTVELSLLCDKPLNLGNNARMIIYGTDPVTQAGRTKVRFDCNGFIDMIIDAGIEFSSNIFVRENPETGEQLTNEPLAVNFTTTIQSWNDLIVSVDLPPFQLKMLKGFGFEVQQATFDNSDLSNPAGMVFPENYEGLSVYGDFPQLWKGLYFRQVTLRLPPELNGGDRMEVLSQNMIIDEMGLTGSFAVTNLLPPEKGNLGGWAFSIDNLNFDLVSNSLTRGGLSGRINMPVMDSTEYMNYSAIIDQKGNFFFTTSMPKSFDVPLLVGKMKVYETSTLSVQREDHDFSVLATLNGEIDIDSPLGDKDNSKDAKGFKVSGLRFERMQIGSMSPYFRPGLWSLAEMGYNSMNGFSVSLSNVESFEQNNDIGLKFTAAVELSGEKFAASTTLRIIGTRYSADDGGNRTRHKLRYKKTELQDLMIDVNDGPICLSGFLAIYKKDPVYGDGFAGGVNALIVKKIGVQVKAVFGEVNGFKYWYADALADFSGSPVPIFTGIAMKGIGGGAYYHMRQARPEGAVFANTDSRTADNMISYTPDKGVVLGFKATLALGTSPGQAFNALATFEIVFNEGGGIRQAMFYGSGVLMKPMNMANPSATDAPVRADVFIGIDFEHDVFHGNFKVYVNAVNGMLTGINPGNLAGEMVIHADPTDWYIHVGRPSARIGLKLKVFGMTVQNGSYFMVGTKIEDMPPPPDEVLRLLQLPMPENRNSGELMSAKGFAFGTYFNIHTGEKHFLIFYASFDMGVGFDVMLSQKNCICAETGEKPGLNGWYAEGQLYAFMEGSIGIDIKVFMVKIHQEILSVGAAILLEAKLPNPFWMRGTVGGYYSLLGGRIKGSFRFQLELGKQCTMVAVEEESASPVEGLTVISELSPGDGRTSIDVFTTPQVVFNYQIGQSFRISDSLESRDYYKIVLDNFDVTADNEKVAGTYKWNKLSDVLVFNPRDILPGNTSVTLKTQVHFEQLINGSWQPVKQDGSLITETKTAVFITGEAPDYVPESNVLYSYPLKNMMNLYRNEYSNGLIQLRSGQEYLFRPDSKWKQYGRFTPVTGGDPIYISFRYDAGKKKVDHIIPATLKNNTIYKFELVNIPASASMAIDANITSVTTVNSDQATDMEITGKVAQSSRNEYQEKVIYTCYFRTSMFNSLSDKIGAITNNYAGFYNAGYSPLVFNISSVLDIPEPFDKYELYGDDVIRPLLKLYALKSGRWLKDYQIPFIYADYPIAGAEIDHRDTAILGLIPVRNVYIDTYNEPFRLLSSEEKSLGTTDFLSVKIFLGYNLSPITWLDYQDMARELAVTPVSNPQKTRLLTEMYPSIVVHAAYPVYVEYKIPFMEKTGTHNIINPKIQ